MQGQTALVDSLLGLHTGKPYRVQSTAKIYGERRKQSSIHLTESPSVSITWKIHCFLALQQEVCIWEIRFGCLCSNLIYLLVNLADFELNGVLAYTSLSSTGCLWTYQNITTGPTLLMILLKLDGEPKDCFSDPFFWSTDTLSVLSASSCY